jgi:hypothetical protein
VQQHIQVDQGRMNMDTPSAGTSDSMAQVVRTRLNELAAALIAGGLTVRLGDGTLVARNPAASDTGDPRGKALTSSPA